MVNVQQENAAVSSRKSTKNKSFKNAKNILLQEKQPDAGGQTLIINQPSKSPVSTSKQSLLIELLQQKNGATIEEMMLATGWQQHSVRGVLSGVVKKRLGLNVTSAKEERGRVYRIVDAVSRL